MRSISTKMLIGGLLAISLVGCGGQSVSSTTPSGSFRMFVLQSNGPQTATQELLGVDAHSGVTSKLQSLPTTLDEVSSNGAIGTTPFEAQPGGLNVVQLNTGNLNHILSSTTALNSSPNSDGSSIAFYTEIVTGIMSTAYIGVANADGSNSRVITGSTMNPGKPQFTPDGNRVVFTADAPNPGAYIVNADGSGLKLLLQDAGVGEALQVDGSWVALSPDGAKLAIVSTADLWIVDLNSGKQSKLCSSVNNSRVFFSPDGNRIAFTASNGVSLHPASIAIDGSDFRPLNGITGLAVGVYAGSK